MTEVDQRKTNQTSRSNFVRGWTQGIFKVQIVAGLSKGDGRDTRSMVPAVRDIGLHAGEHAKLALRGHGYVVQEITITRPVPELDPSQGAGNPIGALDQFEDGSISITTERELSEAQRTATVSESTTQALTRSTGTRVFDVHLFTEQSFEEVMLRLQKPKEEAA